MPPLSDEIVIVSGLPRSGTSLMMQALRAGGLPILTDNFREADEDNPAGYLELEAVKGLPRGDTAFLDNASGHAVKVIHALLKHLPATHRYRVIFMTRDIREVVASQRKMLERAGKPGAAIDDNRLAAVLERQRRDTLNWLNGRDSTLALKVEYGRLVQDPSAAMTDIEVFLNGGLKVEAMASVVRPELHRQKKT